MDSRPIRDSLSSDFSTCVEQLGLKSFLDAGEDSETSSTYTPFVPHPLSVISEKIEWNDEVEDFSDIASDTATVGVDGEYDTDEDEGTVRPASRRPQPRARTPPPPGYVRVGQDTIDAVLFSQIRNHSFDPEHLYKLADSSAQGSNANRLSVASTETSVYSQESEVVGKQPYPEHIAYPDLLSIIKPLSRYFRTLYSQCRDVDTLRNLTECFTEYVTHLVSLEKEYPWPAVVEYHFAFHRNRLVEMRKEVYSMWARVDEGLKLRLLDSRTAGARGRL